MWEKLGSEGRRAVLDYFARADDRHDGITVDGKFITNLDLTHAEVRADEQANHIPYRDGDYLSPSSEYGPVYIPWKYVVRREVVDAETGDILTSTDNSGHAVWPSYHGRCLLLEISLRPTGGTAISTR